MSNESNGFSIDKGILIDLDTILDTRLSTLSLLDRDLTLMLIEDNYFNKRLYDEFGYIDNYSFKQVYKDRNLKTLSKSYITKMTELLSIEIDLISSKKMQSGLTNVVNVDVNIYPYKLNKAISKKITNAIYKTLLTDNVYINLVSIANEELTMKLIESKYDVVIKYDGLEWLDYLLTVKKDNAPSSKLYVPALLQEPIQFNSVKALENLLNSVSELYKPYIDITFISVEFFNYNSIITEKIKKDIEDDIR